MGPHPHTGMSTASSVVSQQNSRVCQAVQAATEGDNRTRSSWGNWLFTKHPYLMAGTAAQPRSTNGTYITYSTLVGTRLVSTVQYNDGCWLSSCVAHTNLLGIPVVIIMD